MNKRFIVGAVVAALGIAGVATGVDSYAASKKSQNASGPYYVAAADPDAQPIASDQLGTSVPKNKAARKVKKSSDASSKKSKKAKKAVVKHQAKPVEKKSSGIVAAPYVAPATPAAAPHFAAPTTPAAPATSTASTVSTSPYTSPQSTTSMATATAVKAETPSPFSFKWRSYNAMDLTGLEGYPTGDKEVRAWERFYFGYNFNDDISFQIVPMFWNTWFGNRDRAQVSGNNLSQSYDAYMDNTQFVLNDSKIAVLAGNIVVDGMLRYDAPTSQQSQANGSPGEVWAELGLSKNFGKFDIKISEMPRYYLQQYNTSTLIDPTSGLPLQNLELRLYSLLDMAYQFTKKFAVTLESGFRNQILYADPTTGRGVVYIDEIIMNPEMTYAFTKTFSLSLGIWETANMRALPTSVYIPLYAENGGEGYLMSTIKF